MPVGPEVEQLGQQETRKERSYPQHPPPPCPTPAEGWCLNSQMPVCKRMSWKSCQKRSCNNIQTLPEMCASEWLGTTKFEPSWTGEGGERKESCQQPGLGGAGAPQA